MFETSRRLSCRNVIILFKPIYSMAATNSKNIEKFRKPKYKLYITYTVDGWLYYIQIYCRQKLDRHLYVISGPNDETMMKPSLEISQIVM